MTQKKLTLSSNYRLFYSIGIHEKEYKENYDLLFQIHNLCIDFKILSQLETGLILMFPVIL